MIDTFQISPNSARAIVASIRSGKKILLNRQMTKASAPLHHLHATAFDKGIRR